MFAGNICVTAYVTLHGSSKISPSTVVRRYAHIPARPALFTLPMTPTCVGNFTI